MADWGRIRVGMVFLGIALCVFTFLGAEGRDEREAKLDKYRRLLAEGKTVRARIEYVMRSDHSKGPTDYSIYYHYQVDGTPLTQHESCSKQTFLRFRSGRQDEVGLKTDFYYPENATIDVRCMPGNEGFASHDPQFQITRGVSSEQTRIIASILGIALIVVSIIWSIISYRMSSGSPRLQ